MMRTKGTQTSRIYVAGGGSRGWRGGEEHERGGTVGGIRKALMSGSIV